MTLATLPPGYPLTAEQLQFQGDCIADVPADWLEQLVDFYGDDDPEGEPLPLAAEGESMPMPRGVLGVDYLDFSTAPHGGVLKLLPEHDQQSPIVPVGIVHHTIVGSGRGAFYYFRDSTGTESHFIVLKNGTIWQLMSLRRSADAQVRGNYWTVNGVGHGFLSVETEDNGDPANDPWTAEQLASLRWLDDTLARIFGWKRQVTPAPYGVSAGGLGRHGMWLNTTWMYADRTTPWTSAANKPCPASARIRQHDSILVPAYLAGTPIEEDDFDMRTDEEILDLVKRGVTAAITAEGSPGRTILRQMASLGARDALSLPVSEIAAAVRAQADDETRILGRLDALNLTLAPAQVTELAAALDLDEQRVADAVRRDLADALAS
jgi:hypothetical protein